MRTIVRASMLALSLLSFCTLTFSQQVAKTIPYPASPDRVIGFLEFRPADYGSQQHPLIIFLHGIGERGNGTSQINSVAANGIPYYCSRGASMRFTVDRQTSSFVVLSPQLSTQYGYWPTFYVKEMIKYAKQNLSIDPNRIYITGLSLGGGGIWRVITDTENWDNTFDAGIAAAAPVCGTQEENDAEFCNTIGANRLPIWAFHSMDDGTVGVGATQHAEILAKNCKVKPDPIFTYYQSGGHGGAWVNAYDTGHITRTVNENGKQKNFTASPNLYEWFLSQSRNNQGQPANTPPVADAGAAQIITLPVNSLTLSGNGTGTNGASISSYSWTKTSGPAAGVISLPLLNTTLVTGLAQGNYVFTLTVTDNHGLSSSASVNVTVNPAANRAPTANAGQDINITLPDNTVTLNGSGNDPDGSISAYNWTKSSGPGGARIANPNAASTNVSNLSAGVYVFTLKVTDNAGATASNDVTVTVNAAPNKAPIAYAGPNQQVTLPDNKVTLDGGTSFDPDGQIDAFYWTKESGPASYKINNQNAAKINVSNLVAGTYVFNLQVRDNDGATSNSSVSVTVNPEAAAQAPPAANDEQPIGYIKMTEGPSQGCDDSRTAGRFAIYSSSIAKGSLVYLDAAHTQLFDGGWNWYAYSPTRSGSVTQCFAIYPNGGMDLITACNGSTSEARPTPPPPPPPPPAANQLPVSNAGPDIDITLPVSSAQLSGNGSYDPDGTISGYWWIQDRGPSSVTFSDQAASNCVVSNLVEGLYNFTLQVKDNTGTPTYSSMIVRVHPAPAVNNQPIGYIKIAAGPAQACDDKSRGGRFPIYSDNIAKGSLVYLDAAHTQLFDGGWNWYSYSPAEHGEVTQAFAIYPNGGMDLLTGCSVNGPSAPAPPPARSNLLGYIKITTGPGQACDDNTTDGRMALYGKSIANGSYVYTDEAMTQIFDGGWNWYSFTPTYGGAVTQAFAVFPIGTIGLLTNCSNSSARLAADQSAALQDSINAASARSIANASATLLGTGKLSLYPNPVRTSSTIELSSTENSNKLVKLYTAGGTLIASYRWQVVKGLNRFTLQQVAGLSAGLYYISISDNKGPEQKLKFIKM
ncbi:MAG TPA: T9SS type A sorting domain-containing protein [Chitinophagaceae bacterium]|nr:T9SS type A sorting domain-containing protein [Chitinophagaceae bacterium]